MQNIKDHIPGVYRIARAQEPLPLVYDSPHSGRIYPADFNYNCDEGLLRRGEDNHVDELLATAPGYGIPLLCAEFPRTYIDVNRAPDDIEPDILAEPWPAPLNPTDRALSGIGLIRREIKPGIPVYNRRLQVKEIIQRLETYYVPYHGALSHLLDGTYGLFGQVWHINWHSMPSLGAVGPLPHNGRRPGNGQPDFVLGDRNGTSCRPDFTNDIKEMLKDLGYSVAINTPYKGVELVRRYSNPKIGRASLQIEINKGLYWNERRLDKNSHFNVLRKDIEIFTQHLRAYVSAHLSQQAAD
ncbi:MAG: N-formylglutamate amidohydrolase [Micavibrio aeruginosavorus]|uniref:N-formylglutamate amidohydrolase n=1 Tax=Micavibrio aeruginosavorus TaxID=349221 RepID=A0A7T5UI73_9BACT|nr:MAG: N-formylglutamate amidohydrolase [Micavibrio aeruginosavorus]